MGQIQRSTKQWPAAGSDMRQNTPYVRDIIISPHSFKCSNTVHNTKAIILIFFFTGVRVFESPRLRNCISSNLWMYNTFRNRVYNVMDDDDAGMYEYRMHGMLGEHFLYQAYRYTNIGAHTVVRRKHFLF